MSLFFNYLFQPFLTAQLGLFGKNINASLLEKFLTAIPGKFKYWDFNLNHNNVFSIEGFILFQRSNFILSLNKPYETLRGEYRENIKRNIKKNRVQSITSNTIGGKYISPPLQYKHLACIALRSLIKENQVRILIVDYFTKHKTIKSKEK